MKNQLLAEEIELFSNEDIRVTNQRLIVPGHTWPIHIFQPVQVITYGGRNFIRLEDIDSQHIHTLEFAKKKQAQLIVEAINHALGGPMPEHPLSMPFWRWQKVLVFVLSILIVPCLTYSLLFEVLMSGSNPGAAGGVAMVASALGIPIGIILGIIFPFVLFAILEKMKSPDTEKID